MAYERLTLPEEFLLLGWEDQRGWNRYTDNLAMLLAGATILELVLEERVSVTDDRLHATGTDTGHPTLDLALERIRGSRRPRTTKSWVQRLGNRPGLKRSVMQHLAGRGVLRQERRRLLGLFPVTRYPVADHQRVAWTRERVTRTLTGSEPVDDPRDAALGGLVHPAGRLLRFLVPREQRRAAKQRAKALSKGEAMSADIAQAIGEANTAAMAAVGAAAAASSSSSSGS